MTLAHRRLMRRNRPCTRRCRVSRSVSASMAVAAELAGKQDRIQRELHVADADWAHLTLSRDLDLSR